MNRLRKAAFGMRCFWGPDALFGSLEGVVRTRVGYAGGEKEDPTYESLGDHTETVLVEYDPGEIGYEDLLEAFWEKHDYTRRRKPQYASKIFYMTEEQKQKAEESMKEDAATEVQQLEEFYIAEEYHQKYRLRHSRLMKEFENMASEEFMDSPLAAKANGAAAGHLDREEFERYRKKLRD